MRGTGGSRWNAFQVMDAFYLTHTQTQFQRVMRSLLRPLHSVFVPSLQILAGFHACSAAPLQGAFPGPPTPGRGRRLDAQLQRGTALWSPWKDVDVKLN